MNQFVITHLDHELAKSQDRVAMDGVDYPEQFCHILPDRRVRMMLKLRREFLGAL